MDQNIPDGCDAISAKDGNHVYRRKVGQDAASNVDLRYQNLPLSSTRGGQPGYAGAGGSLDQETAETPSAGMEGIGVAGKLPPNKAAKGLMENCLTIFEARFSATHHDLLRLHDVPAHLQFNPYVHAGYREVQDFWGCLLSLFYLHNETVNIFTHVAPIVWILMYWESMYPWQEVSDNPFLRTLGCCHILASISPWIGSVTYHLFMNHKGGVKLYNILLQLDMFGIWVTECFGALPNLIAATWCLPVELQAVIMIVYAISSVWGLRKAMKAWTPLGRRMCFVPVFTARILGFLLRISKYGGGDPNILIDVILQDAVSILGGMIGVIRIPEKWFPGKLDLLLNSHHIMHVLVVLAVFHMNRATNGDIGWILHHYNTGSCDTHPINSAL